MRPTLFLGLAIAGLSVVSALAPPAARAEAARRPNIVIILSDDHGYADVGFHGCQDIPTPNLDALAQSGVRFSNGYVSGPYCSPTRAGLLDRPLPAAVRPRVQPGRDGLGERRPSAVGNHDCRSAEGGRLRDRTGRQVASRQRSRVSPAAPGIRRVLRVPRRCASLLPRRGRADLPRNRSRSRRQEYLTDAFAREAVAFVERHKQGPVLPLPRLQRRAHADARDRRPAAPVRVDQGRDASDLCRDADRAGRGRRQGAREACARRASRKTR